MTAFFDAWKVEFEFGMVWTIVQKMNFEQRSNFCCKLGKTAAETNQIMQIIYDDERSPRPTIYEWFKSFKESREDIT